MHILKFKANWCGPCKVMDQVIKDSKLDIHVGDIDIDVAQNTAVEYGIRGVPTLIMLGHENEELGRKTGVMTVDQFKQWVKSFE